MKLLSAVVLITVLHLSGNVRAQVFIADTNARAMLNALIPGVVDGAGIMDTLHPAIATLDTALIDMHPFDEVPSMNFNGLQYLDSVEDLRIVGSPSGMSGQVLHVDAVPAGLSSLLVFPEDGTVDLPQLPESVRDIQLVGHHPGEVATVNIAGMPDSLDGLYISSWIASVQWPGQPFIGGLAVYNGTGNMTMSPVTAGTVSVALTVDPITFLSSIHTRWLFMMSCTLSADVVWPEELTKLELSSCSFEGTSGSFPSSLDTLSMEGMAPGCLEWLPDGLLYFSVHYYQFDYDCIPNWPASLDVIHTAIAGDLYPGDVEYCSVLNTICPGAWPGVSGHILMDLDQNGQCDPGEPALPQASVTLQPGGNATGCDANGFWEIGVQPGNYAITPSSTYPYFQSISPAQHTADLPNMGDADTLNDFAVTLIPDMQDLRAHFVAQRARPGFNNRLYLTCENYGTVPMDAELTLTFDADQTWVGSSMPPTTQAGTTATWQLGIIGIGASQLITVDLNTASTVALGTDIEHSITALPTTGDQTPLDNAINYTDSVVGSSDPNDKQVRPSSLTPAVVQAGAEPIEYTIRFQNTGTFLAERVVIVDTLPEGLQPQSVEFLSSSHTCHWYVLDGVLHFIHEGINLPDSTSDEPGSHGYVQFRILPDTDLPDGAEVVNIAQIVFDFNAPVVTPPSIFHVDASTAVQEMAHAGMEVHPNPVRDRLWMTLPVNDRAQVTYTVQDLFGRNVMTGRTTSDVAVDVSSLPSGVFVLSATSSTGTFNTRFVKQ